MLKFIHDNIEKTCEWVYVNLDSFFQGSSNRNIEVDGLNSTNDMISGCCQEWELNQGIVDIALKDVQGSLGWLLPGFIKQFAIRVYQKLLLYFFIDTILDQDSSVGDFKRIVYTKQSTWEESRFVITIKKFNERIDYKLISINEWCVSKIRTFINLKSQKKTYYLLSYFGPSEYDYSIDNQNYMIRGPDFKIKPVLTFHIRK